MTDSQSVYLGVEPTLGLVTRYYFLLQGCCLKVVVSFLWSALSDEKTSLQFAVQSLNGLSRAEPGTILYCLVWDSPQPGEPGSCIYIPQEQGGPVTPPGIGFPLRPLLRLAWRWSERYLFFLIPFYFKPVPVHSANFVKRCTVACRRVLSSALL
jgi:hypothetical protein